MYFIIFFINLKANEYFIVWSVFFYVKKDINFDKDCSNLLMLIEIDDSTHNSYKRRQRDEKVNNICHDVGIKILHFYTSYPNEEGYVLNRILKNLNNNIDNKVSNTEENNTYTLVR